MIENNFLVSIGLPVYNGEKYIEIALESLVSQDYENIEIIISDNASTDSTLEICTKFAQLDSKVKIFREDTNKGSGFNFQKVFDLSLGKYFMWAAHDDIFDKTFVRKCVQKMEASPDALLCLSDLVFIDENGNPTTQTYTTMDTVGKTILENAEHFFNKCGWYETYGLYRPETIRNRKVDLSRFGSDVTYALEIMLRGDIVKVNEPLFYYRTPNKSKEEYIKVFNPSIASAIRTPYADLARDMINIIKSTSIDMSYKDQLIRNFIDVLTHQNEPFKNLIFKDYFPDLLFGVVREQQMELVEMIVLNDSDEEMLREKIKKVKLLDNQIKSLSQGRPIYIWGGGSGGEKVAKLLMQRAIEIEGFIDSNPTRWKKYLLEGEIHSPDEILKNSHDSSKRAFIVIASIYSQEIRATLINRGYLESVDFVVAIFT